jgi:hypothetical protein
MFMEGRLQGDKFPKTIRSSRVVGDGVTAPGHVVLRDMGPGSYMRYAVHFYNEQDRGFHEGNYTDDIAKAEEYYVQRCRRFGVAHGPTMRVVR